MIPALAPINVSAPSTMQPPMNPSQAPAKPSPEKVPKRRGRPPGKGNSARKRPRHSSSSESSSSPPEPSSDDDDSDANSDSSRPHHSRRGSAAEEAMFISALTRFLEGQHEAGKKLLRKHRHLDALKLYSGMPTVNAYHLWLAVMAVGGYETVR